MRSERFPVSMRENFHRVYEGKGLWMLTGAESNIFCPRVIPDNIARGPVPSGLVGRRDLSPVACPMAFVACHHGKNLLYFL